MAYEPLRIDFEQFLADPRLIFEQVRQRGGPILVEHNGETFRLEKESSLNGWSEYDLDEARRGLHRAAGALDGVDIDELLADIRDQRGQDSCSRHTMTFGPT